MGGMVKRGQNCQKLSKLPKMVQNGPKWSKMVPNGPKWSKWSKMVKGPWPKWSKMVKSSKKWPKNVKKKMGGLTLSGLDVPT